MSSRRDRILSLLDLSGLGLEIGPGFNPLLPKSAGHRVETLDHASRDDLVRKYAGAAGVDPSCIEEVDHVSDGASVLATIGQTGRYRYIVASHVIEHTVDMLGFLRDCEALLDPDGVLVLAVPDKRFSFDVLRPLCSTGDVLQAHVDGRVRHTPGRIFDEVAYNALRDGALAWPPHAGGTLSFFRPLSDAKAMFEQVRSDPSFHDIHAWQFTPSSFRLIVNDLHEIGYLGLREQVVHDDMGSEFVVGLSRRGAGPDCARITLAQRVFDELRAVRTAVTGVGKKA